MKPLAAFTLALAGWGAAAPTPAVSNNTHVTDPSKDMPWHRLHEYMYKFHPKNQTVAIATLPEAIRTGLLDQLRRKIIVTATQDQADHPRESPAPLYINTRPYNLSDSLWAKSDEKHDKADPPRETPAPLYNNTEQQLKHHIDLWAGPSDEKHDPPKGPGIPGWPLYNNLGPVIVPETEDADVVNGAAPPASVPEGQLEGRSPQGTPQLYMSCVLAHHGQITECVKYLPY